MSEEWRDVNGWPYEVSSTGRVRRSRDGGSPIAKAGRELKCSPDVDGYRRATFCDGDRTRTVKVHVLMLETFVGPCPDDCYLGRHLDGDHTNNDVSNLAWGTALDNADDCRRHGRQRDGETNPRARFTQAQVDQLRAEFEATLTARRAAGFVRVPRGWVAAQAERYGVPKVTITQVARGAGYGGVHPYRKATL